MVLEIIETLESDWLSNKRNAILYSLLSSLEPCIEEYCDKGIGGTTASRATLIHLADEEVGDRPSSFFAFASTLIVFFANSSQLQSLVALVYLGLQARDPDRALTKGLNLGMNEIGIF